MTDAADTTATPARGTVHILLLWLFTALFALRIAAQFVQAVSPTPSLPPFDAWQGSGLEYPVLLTSQVLVIAAMILTARSLGRGTNASRRVGSLLVLLGGVYFVSMSLRLVLGLTVLSDVGWFAKPLPAVFHMVLAGYVLTVGHYRLGASAQRTS